MVKHYNDKHTRFCDYVIGIDDVLITLNILSSNLSKGWLQSKIQRSDEVCRTLKGNEDNMSKMTSKVFYKDGTTSNVLDHNKIIHRVDGPAIILYSKKGKIISKSWYINDIEYTEEEFNDTIRGGNYG